MATFLELCRDVARESGTLAGGVTLPSVVNATGRADKVVSWTNKAWQKIQTDRRDWRWMQRQFASALAIGVARYTPASFGVDARFGAWATDQRCFRPFTIYDVSIGRADETEIREIEWETWLYRYDRGAHDADRPAEYAISPLNEVCLGVTPDKAYAIRGGYKASPQVLALNTDVPEMPAEYHGAIVWRALRLLALSDEAQFSLQGSIAEYAEDMRKLERDQLPPTMILGSPLA